MNIYEKIEFVESDKIRPWLQELYEMENKEEQFETACEIFDYKISPPFNKTEWKIVCDLTETPYFDFFFF